MELWWADHLLFLLVGVALPLRMMFGAGQLELGKIRFDTRMKLALYYGNSFYLWVVTAAVAGIWYWSDRPFPLLGFDRADLGSWSITSLIVVGLFVLLYLADVLGEISSARNRESTRREFRKKLGFLPVNGYEFAHYLFLAFSAGFCEEVIFRGYFIRYCQTLFNRFDGSSTLAILLPAVLFGMAHFYQGGKTVIKVVAMAVMFGYLFVETGSLWVLIALHFGVDAAGGLIAWALLDDSAGPQEEE